MVNTTPHLLATSTSSPLLELRGVQHLQHLSAEQQNLPRRRLHGGYDAKDAAAAQSRLNFGLSSGRGSEVDRRDLDIASTEGNGVERRRRCRTEQADQSFLRSPSYTTKPPSAPDPATDHEPKPAEMREPWGSTHHEGGSRRIHRRSPGTESSDPAWSATTTTTPRRPTAFKPKIQNWIRSEPGSTRDHRSCPPRSRHHAASRPPPPPRRARRRQEIRPPRRPTPR